MRLAVGPFFKGGDLAQRNNCGVIQLFRQSGQIVRQRKAAQINKNVQNPVTSHVQTLFKMVNETLIQP
jgi:hypothetical protein